MTATDARQITAAARKTAIRSIYEKIRIAANEGESSIVFRGYKTVNKSVIEQLQSGTEEEKFELEYSQIEDTENYELISIRW